MIAYLRARLGERSTWAGISAGTVAASVLSSPWSYVVAVIGVIMVLVPEQAK